MLEKVDVTDFDKNRILRIAILSFAAAAALLAVLGGIAESQSLFRIAEWLLIAALGVTVLLAPPRQTEQEIAFGSARTLLVCVLLVALGFAAYGNTISMHFIDGDDYIHLNDARYLIENVGIRSYFDFFVRATHNDAEQFMRPLLNAPFVLGYLLFDSSSRGFHVMNILVHALTGVAIFLFVFQLSRRRCMGAFAGALYVAHPLITRPIAWTATLTHSCSALFFFGALFFFVLYRRSKKKRSAFLVSCLFLLIDLMLWELAALLPFLFLMLDLLFFRPEVKGRFWRPSMPVYVAWFGIVALYALQVLIRIGLFDIDVGWEYLGYRFAGKERLPLGSFFGILADGLFRPFHQAVFYGQKLQVLSMASLLLHAALLLWIGLGRHGDRRIVLFGLALAVVTYLPARNNAQFVMEFLMRARLFMLPAAGVSIALSSLLLTDERKRRLALIAAGIVVLLFAGLTASNNKAWVREAENQASLERQLWEVLAGIEAQRPVVFIPVSATIYNAERTEDHVETMFARWCYEHPGYATPWRIVYNARLVKDAGFTGERKRPVFFEVSNDVKTLTDVTSLVLHKAEVLSQSLDTKLTLTRHEKTPTHWKWSTLGLDVPGESGVRLEGAMHEITVNLLYLHVPPQGLLEKSSTE